MLAGVNMLFARLSSLKPQEHQLNYQNKNFTGHYSNFNFIITILHVKTVRTLKSWTPHFFWHIFSWLSNERSSYRQQTLAFLRCWKRYSFCVDKEILLDNYKKIMYKKVNCSWFECPHWKWVKVGRRCLNAFITEVLRLLKRKLKLPTRT